MRQQKLFTIEDEAVWLALTSERTRRSVAEDLSGGLSTLTRWIERSKDRKPDLFLDSEQADRAAELKWLRRENEVLGQERDILKRSTAFSSEREVDEVCSCRCAKEACLVHRLCRVLGVSQSGILPEEPSCQ